MCQGRVELEFGVFGAEFTSEDSPGGFEGFDTRVVARELLTLSRSGWFPKKRKAP